MELAKRAQALLANNDYINIATGSADSLLWNTPVYAAYDHDLNFYWSSRKKAEHSINIRANDKVFMTIYDSTCKRGDNNRRCLYIQGVAVELDDVTEIENALEHLYGDEGSVDPLFTLGDLELFGDFPAVKNVRVVKASLLLSAPMSIIHENEQNNPHFLQLVLHQLVRKLNSMSEKMIQLSWPLAYRLALYLLEQQKVDGSVFELVRRETLAGLLGTSVRHGNGALPVW